MKRYFYILLIALFFTNCAPSIYMNSYVIDLSKYNSQGLFITESNSVMFDYDPVGLVGTFGGGKEFVKGGTTKLLTLEDVFSKFVEDCKSKGANAVINIKIEQKYDQSNGNTFYISGMAIKRK